MINLLPMLFTALTEGPKLFEAGKDIYETVTGSASTAATPDDLQAEIHALPPEQAEAWAEKMKVKVDLYKAENERLANEQGRISDDLIHKVDSKTASRIAYLRMATRPETVRMMAQYIMLPLYLMVVDGYLAWCNIWLTFFGHTRQLQYLASMFFDSNSTYAEMYGAGVVPATTVVLTYMTLRQMEKGVKSNPVSSAISVVRKMIGR